MKSEVRININLALFVKNVFLNFKKIGEIYYLTINLKFYIVMVFYVSPPKSFVNLKKEYESHKFMFVNHKTKLKILGF